MALELSDRISEDSSAPNAGRDPRRVAVGIAVRFGVARSFADDWGMLSASSPRT